ncbi:MAG: hypothetical protein OXD43_02445 [Bacteroidetes bacterium]|nr:hypothetical protein [Bacteroidota bacterium]
MKVLFWWVILAALGIGCNSRTESGYSTILEEQNTRYPAMEVQDWYKLAHQAVFGAGHAIQNVEAAHDWLIREWEGFDSLSNEPLLEILGPESTYARINLRPYKSAGGRSDELFRIFLQTANQETELSNGFERYWQSLREAARKRMIAVRVDALDSLYSIMSAGGFPAIHHSERYSELYHPAYRVVSYELVRDMQHQ